MTLEKGKGYGQEQIQQTLQDKARTRLNNPAPHQAPQRERVSRAAIPGSTRAPPLRRKASRRWKTLIRPDVNMGVPQLMMILEPNIVWEHTKTYVPAVGKEVEASVTPGEFFEGWHKGGRRAHGVYEGSYWELIGDCDELAEMLRKMSKAPALLDEPPMELPPPPELPAWDEFRPNLHIIPAAPSLPPLKLPPFRAPILETEVPFVEPEYLPVPTVPQTPKEEPVPIFIPPEFLAVDPLVEPQYVDPLPPVLSEPPRPPTFGRPEHGADWTGERPFQVELPVRETFLKEAAAQRIMDTSRWAHPPAGLPPLPELEQLPADMLQGLDLEPIPRLELAWMGGPEPDPPYASMPATPEALSRHSSRPTSGARTRPVSAMTGYTGFVSSFNSTTMAATTEGGGASPLGSAQPSGRWTPSAVQSSRTRVSSATPSNTGGQGLPAIAEPEAGAPSDAEGGEEEGEREVEAEAPASGRGTATDTPVTGDGTDGVEDGTGAGDATGDEWPAADAGVTDGEGGDDGGANAAQAEPVAEAAPAASTSRAARPVSAKGAAPAGRERRTIRSKTMGPAVGGGRSTSEPGIPFSRARTSRRPGAAGAGAGRNVSPPRRPEDIAWEDARQIPAEASGTPRIWLNFQGPFAELPPIMMPPRPEPGPEPLPEHFPHEPLEELPAFVPPAPLPAPAYVEPAREVPDWRPPCEPRPVGFLRGSAPVVICDVSGTMHPRQQGRFRDMKRCAVELLDPEGEIATAAAGFDVITFSGGAWSWSAGYGERMGLLQSSQVLYAGRQVGGRYSSKTPGGGSAGGGGGSRSNSPDRMAGNGRSGGGGGGLALLPAQPDLLSDAQRWVANWPDAVGQTNLMAAFSLAEQHAGADCWYILSDGMAHDQSLCVEFLSQRAQAGLPLPVIHAVGFIPADASPDCAGERFLRGLAELTGGSYQRYQPEVARVWQPGKGFVRVDLRNETPEQRAERDWAEKQLRAERQKNIRLGIHEPLDATMERVAAMHAQMRVTPAMRAAEAAALEAQRRHTAALEATRDANERALAEAAAAHEAAVEAARCRNQARVDAARAAFLAAHSEWERSYLERLQDWEDTKAMLERQREEQYDAVMGLERLADKLSPAPTPPGSRPASALPAGSRPASALPASSVPSLSPRSSALGHTPSSTSAAGTASAGAGPSPAPPSASPQRSAVKLGLDDGGLSAEFLATITEDLAEASAPVDAVFVGAVGNRVNSGALAEAPRASTAAAAAAADALDDDGLDVVRPSSSARRGSAGSRAGRDQDQDKRTDRSPPSSATGSAARPAGSPPDTRPGSGALAPSSGHSRPPSGRPLSHRGSSAAARPVSARPQSSRPLSGVGSRGLLPEGSPLPPPLPEPSAPLEKLRGESSEDFKRRILPEAVVAEHDAGNVERLESIRRRWEALVAEDMAAGKGVKVAVLQRNAERIAAYRDAVYEAYAASLVRDVVQGGAVRVATNLLLMDDADARYRVALAEAHAENARLRQLHLDELEDRRAKEEAHAQAHKQWEDNRDALLAEHEEDRARARAEHQANLERLRAEWEEKRKQVEDLNAARLAEAEAMYAALVETVKDANKQHKTEHTEMLRQRKEIEATNLSRMALCARLSEEYEEARVQAEADHAELCAFLRAANEQLTEEARRRYQEALAEVQAAYEADCVAAREAHEKDMERVRRFNADIWPKVAVARLAAAELGRVQAFAEHIRHCANKYEMGVNLVPNTPNYDRVVEMQALTEGLAKAFPDKPPTELPWPDHERRLEPGTGWVAAPAARPLTYRDPAEIISKIAKGKATSAGSSPAGSPSTPIPRGSPVPPRAPSAVPLLPEAPGSPSPQPEEQHAQPLLRRPLSAGRARFAGVLAADLSGLRPQSALMPSPQPANNRLEAWAAAAPSALSSPGGGGAMYGRPASAAGYANPSAWRRSNTTMLRAPSPRGPVGTSHMGSASGAVAAAAAAAAAAASNNLVRPAPGQPPSRPTTAQLQQQSILPLGLVRPRSAGPAPLPARVAVDVQPLQASVARAKAQAGVHALGSASLAGFAKDVPRLRYPEVDVQQPLSVTR
ncbi:hypothetical protein GPECTOR_16g760 [Gonium pectorale]|uniref:VWFA domain-containing protein n=1 Tax=Gonium pectorale TaxID=33097 RepID=A0A150GLH0_GONPE|nr:hypothetical protein GPECTOR_16g760 [Gonium pectorale]|eukprot:KXZ50585.1 hypothetical protein GPECTOR_16g760 [Gonium pectorale]